jgi:hypothetical protein
MIATRIPNIAIRRSIPLSFVIVILFLNIIRIIREAVLVIASHQR